MPQVSVNITFDAADAAEANAKIMGWTLHEGCTVLVNTPAPPPTMLETTQDGDLVEAPEPEGPVVA